MQSIGKVLGNIVGVLLALALTAALGYYGYFVAKRFVVLFARLDFPVAIVTATATVALLLAALIVAGSIRRTAQHNAEVQRRADKAEAYKLFISVWEEMFRPGQTPEGLLQLSGQMQDLNHLLLLHGCPAVVKVHTALPSLNFTEARSQFAEVLVAIRKDLGMEMRGLEAKDLLQLVASEPVKLSASSRTDTHRDTQPRVSLAPN
jgi:hypothetical protein